MIQKIVEIQHGIYAKDCVELSWFDMKKPHLTAVSKEGVEFVLKQGSQHLHTGDVLVCENGHTIIIQKGLDNIYTLEFEVSLLFAKTAYEIGNRHQPICIDNMKITVLEDVSLQDIIAHLETEKAVHVTKTTGYFTQNAHAHHTH